MATTTWIGASGARYTYEIHPVGTRFNAVPANYIFAKLLTTGRSSALYIGQTDNLKERITPSHHKWPCAEQNGMTHIHVHRNASAAARLAEEQDLLNGMSPVCND